MNKVIGDKKLWIEIWIENYANWEKEIVNRNRLDYLYE